MHKLISIPLIWSRWLFIFLSLLMLSLTVFPWGILAQSSSLDIMNKAPILVDGDVLFKVGSFNNFSAQQRADIINNTLAQEVRSPEPVELVIVQDSQPTVIRNQTTKRHLLSVTEVDVIEGTNTFEQAIIWKNHLNKALQRGQFERTSGYVHQAILLSLGIILGVVIIHGVLIYYRREVFTRPLWPNDSINRRNI
ncbi:MAG: hypothetical protein QNJ33_20205 [Crocosphaera sp.]|nr:hypothetical protein [Crocosphaera sp.]